MSSEDVWDLLKRNGWELKEDGLSPDLATFEHKNIKGDITVPLKKKEMPDSMLNEILKKAGLI